MHRKEEAKLLANDRFGVTEAQNLQYCFATSAVAKITKQNIKKLAILLFQKIIIMAEMLIIIIYVQ